MKFRQFFAVVVLACGVLPHSVGVAVAAPGAAAEQADAETALLRLRELVRMQGQHEAQAGRLVRGLLSHASEDQLVEAWGMLEVFRRRIGAEYGVPVPEHAGAGFAVGLELARQSQVPAEQVVSVLIREADLLRPAAQDFLKVLYEQKIEGFRQYDPRILQWFMRTADEGLLSSQRFVARVLLYGLGVEAETERARAILEGIESGEGLLDLAEYETVVGNAAVARRYLQQAAEEYGLASGWYNLGVEAKQGGNAVQARSYFEKALVLDADFYPAMVEQALLLAAGAGGERDVERANALMRRVAEEAPGQERYIAMANLGYFLMRGLGVAPDPVAARRYLQRALDHGVEEARPLLQQLQQR